MSKIINNHALKMFKSNVVTSSKDNNKIVKSKQKQDFELFIKFIFLNLIKSFSNIFLILILPIFIFALSIYLYSFFDSFSVVVLLPSTFIGLFIFPRAMYRYHNQWLIMRRFSNYAIIAIMYFLFCFVWQFIMLALYVLIGAGYWDKGIVINNATQLRSPGLLDFLSNVNWGSMIFSFLQVSFISICIGMFIAFAFYRRTAQWICIILSFLFVLIFALLVVPGIFPQLPLGIQYLTYLSPFTASFNNTYIAFSAGNIFDINHDFLTLVISKSDIVASKYFNDTTFNILNLLINLIVCVAVTNYLIFYYIWNNNKKHNYNPNNKLFIEIKNLKRTSSFKTLLFGIPESFKLEGMDSPYKNYIFNITHKKWNKMVCDILTNNVRTFNDETIQFNNIDVLDEIQVLYFNQAPFSGLKVKDILNYYKRTDLTRYQSIINRFDFSKMLNAKIEFLDYDYLFYLYIFSMIFNGKKIFIIDNDTLVKVSSKIVPLVESNKLNYWLINNIQYDEN